MTMRRLVSLITGVLIIAIFLPIALSLWLANRQANDLFEKEMRVAMTLSGVRRVADLSRDHLVGGGRAGD